MTHTWKLSAGIALAACMCGAADFYVDPDHGSPTRDGSAGNPWGSLQKVIDSGCIRSRAWNKLPYTPDRKLVPVHEQGPVRPGDTIWLRTGDHGDVVIRKHYNEKYITIAAAKGHTPRLRSLRLQSVRAMPPRRFLSP
jgi:hypothetical protein